MNRRGQFSIIAALLVSVVLVATVIITYSMIRNNPTQELPQVQSPIDETNLALKQILAYTIGYYGSVLQVTGNSSYAKMMATNYLQSGLINIANMHPDWGASFSVSNEILSTNWFMNSSYSKGSMTVKYNLTGLGLTGITYQTSENLSAQVEFGTSTNQAEVIVTANGAPVVNLGQQNFKFYYYSYSNSSFELISPSAEPVAFANGTYLISIPSGVNPYSYAVQVVDQRGIMVTVWSFNHYLITLNWNSLYSTLQGETIVMEMLQNGTIRWLGQNLQSTQTLPIPPIPVKAIRVNETTTNGRNSQVPFQIEDWNNNYTVPQGLTGNATIFSKRQMIVFLVNHNIAKVTLWWNGSDTVKQTPYAYTDRYFTNDNTANGILTNGILTLNINNWLTSTVGSSTATASFMGINGVTPTYGSAPSYVIFNGVVRDIVQQEAEWSGGVSNCPNVYSQIVITLPANATYYTYQLQLIFIKSNQSRTITSMCPIQITASTTSLQTENGTSGGYPIVQSSTGTSYTGTFYNASSVWQHHWSQFISGTTGTGIMFTDYANKMLYAFDTSTSKTGAVTVSSTAKTIQLLPVTRSSVSFQSAKDVIWYGAVVTFSGKTPIYNSSTKSGLWITVEDPPQLTVTTSNWVSVTVTSSPSGTGYVEVDGNNITTPYTFTWMTYSTHTLQAISPVSGGTGVRYNFTSWSDGGAQNHTYIVPSKNATVTANYKTQYQISFIVSPSGGGTTTPSGTNIWVNAGVISISVTPNPVYSFSSWAASGSISIANPSLANTTATINGPGTITATLSLTSAYITVTSSPSGSGFIKVDGTAITTPHTYLWTIGSNHTLQALSPVSGATGTQYVYTGWSDGGAQTHTYTVPSQSATVTANYNTQYYLTVNNGGHSTASGSGWYYAGANATFSISQTTVSGGTGIQYIFINWIGAGTGAYTGSASSHSVTMNNAINETANWQTQYQVTFNYQVTGGGSGYSAPSVNYTSLGSQHSVTASSTATVWADSGSTYTYTNPLSGSSSTEQWSTSTATGTVTATGTISKTYYNQYSFTLSYTISGGGTGYTAPTLTGTQYGQTYTPTLTGTATAYWLDSGSTWSVTNPLGGSGTTERWDTSQTTTGTVSTTQTTAFTYYNQYSFVLSYTISGGGTPTAPTLTAKQFGASYTPTLTGTATTYWLDSDQTWSVTNPLGGSGTSERWQTSQTVSGTVSASQTTVYTYYNQYSFTLSYTVSGGGTPTAPTLTAKQFGASYTPTLSISGTQYWLDAGQSWSVTNPLGGSGTTERWDTSQTTTGTVSSSSPTTAGGSLTFTYYNQYSMTLSYSVSGGGSGYSAPTFTANQFGASAPQTLTTTATAYWFDSGSSWTVTNPLSGSSTSERWQTSQSTSGTVSASTIIVFTYYNQYSITFQYAVSGGGTGYSAPTVTYTQFGTGGNTVTAVTSGGTAVWVDAGTTYTYTNPLSGSSSTEQWSTSTATGTVTATGTISKTYYNQYSFTLSYTISGGGTGYTAPTLTGTQYGQTYTPTLTGTATVYWLDSGSTWSITNPLGGSGTSERWQTSQTVSGTVSASQTTIFTYYNQYSFTLSYTISGGGTPTAPTLTAKQFGASYTPTLTGTATTYWLDSGQTWSVTNPLGGSGTTERWDTSQTTSGIVSTSSPTTAGGTLTFTYYNQYSITFGYGDQDGSIITSGSQIGSYYQFGSSSGIINSGSTYGSTSPTSAWVDAGSGMMSYQTFTSGGQRWALSTSPTSFTVSSSTTISDPSFYHQYSFQLDYAVSGGGTPTAPTLTSTQFGISYTPTLTTSLVTYWLDNAKTWSVTNPLGGSGTSERWDTSQTTSGTVSASSPTTAGGTLTFTYYNQYSVTFQYAESGGGSGYSAPTVTYTQFGVGGNTVTAVLTGGTAVWVDAGTTYTYTNPLSGSGSAEQWSTSTATGTAAASGTVSKTYYNQYSFTLSYTVSGGGSGYSAPTLTGTQYGQTYTPTLTGTATAYWLDSGSTWSVTNPLGGSGTTERWDTSQTTTGTVSASSPTTAGGTLTFTYYNQYLMTLSYSVTGGSGYSAPTFSANAFGASAPQTLTTTATGYWFDAGASWTVTNPLAGGSATYRWYTTQSTSGTVSVQTIAFVYNYQVFGIDTNCIGFGSESSSGSSSITTTSMTAKANELIIVVITAGSSSGSHTRTFTVTDSFGDAYTLRGNTSSGSSAEQIAEYYAFTGSHTGSFNVTVTPSSYNRNFDVLAFGITGAAASPFDTHTGLPYLAHNTGSSAPTVTGVSTSNANDMILAFEGHLSSTADTVGTLAGTAFSAPSGFLNNANGEGCNAEYQIVSSTLSSATATFGTSESNWVMMVDAVQRAW